MSGDFGVSTTRAIACLMTILVVSGCSATKESQMKDAFDALMKRPSLTVVEADSQSMYSTIRERLVAEVGVSAWLDDVEPISGTGCTGELSHLYESQERLYNAGSSSGNLPDAKWG